MALQRWLAPGAGALHGMFTAIEVLIWCWMPLYLLLMQKRAYGQGWTMTFLKYSVLGVCYVVLLSFGAAFAAVLSLVYASVGPAPSTVLPVLARQRRRSGLRSRRPFACLGRFSMTSVTRKAEVCGLRGGG